MQQHSIHNLPLIESSVTKLPVTKQDIYLALDESGNIQFFLFIKNKLVTNNVIGNINFSLNDEQEVYWTYTQREGEYSIFAGSISNKRITKVEVNNLQNNDLAYFKYHGVQTIFSEEELSTPIWITGYSVQNEVIYTNRN